MALRQMKLLGQINKILKVEPPPSIIRINVRNFKRARNHTLTPAEDVSLTPLKGVPGDNIPLSSNNLWKPFCFTIAFSSASLAAAAIWQYENMRSRALSILRKPVGWTSLQLRTAKVHTANWRNEANQWWNNFSEGEKIFFPICLANVLVFAGWRIPRLQPLMIRYFCSNPASRSVCWPMFLSTFSHYSAFHLIANMYVLHSFSSGAVATLGKEQFLGLYLSAGVVSSFTSYVYKTLTKQPGLSLGASGAIMAILGYVCTEYPDTTLGIIFLPFLTFSAGSAIKAIIAFDCAGAILGWRLFDHAAHLGGAFSGILWALWGNEHIWKNREPLLQYWQDIRGNRPR